MLQSLLWALLWALLRSVLNVGKDFVNAAVEAVSNAETLKKEDGTLYSGPEKKEYVTAQLVKFWSQIGWVAEGQRITNVVVEFAVSYLKSK